MTMLVTWLIEIYLNQLGELKEQQKDGSAVFKGLQREFQTFLTQTRVKVSCLFFVSLFKFFYPCLSPPFSLISLYMSVYVSLCVCLFLSVSLSLSLSLYLCLPLSFSVCLCLSMSPSLSVSVCVSVCLSVSLSDPDQPACLTEVDWSWNFLLLICFLISKGQETSIFSFFVTQKLFYDLIVILLQRDWMSPLLAEDRSFIYDVVENIRGTWVTWLFTKI